VKKAFKKVSGLSLLVFAGLQFIYQPHENPPVVPGHDLLAVQTPPPAIAGMLKNSCYDCHSYETKWPWYSFVAPVSWLVARDVNAARPALNFSEWPQQEGRSRKRWRHIANELQDNEMPPANYLRMHPAARLDASQRAELARWAQEQGGQ
jgi:hypothetical protein